MTTGTRKETTVEVNGKEIDKGEHPILWWTITIVLMFIVTVALILALSLSLIFITLSLFSIPIFVILDGLLWIPTREHYFVHYGGETLAIGWKQGTKYRKD